VGSSSSINNGDDLSTAIAQVKAVLRATREVMVSGTWRDGYHELVLYSTTSMAQLPLAPLPPTRFPLAWLQAQELHGPSARIT
jgi:hypothetical protein